MKQIILPLPGLVLLLLAGADGFAVNTRQLTTQDSTHLYMVQASPPRESASSATPEESFPRPRRSIPQKLRRTPPRNNINAINTEQADDVHSKWERAVTVENQMVLASEALQETLAIRETDYRSSRSIAALRFPSVRDCNAALATFGDGGELLRALRLFMKMRKAASLAQGKLRWPVPSPTLVTYSTIMSRANRMGKPKVALRMWKLMQQSPEFVRVAGGDTRSNDIVPDIKAANILMNSFAKLSDIASAQDLLNQMLHGNGTDVPRLEPNRITYNTLMDACHKAGDLDAALHTLAQLNESGITPDAWTYTSLIATVARKPSTAAGANDPSLAFTFLDEMKQRNIQPNGMTYSALIDACGRCRRHDLALQGLRLMLREKAVEQRALTQQQEYALQKQTMKASKGNPKSSYKGKPENYSLSNEVGAWTAAINALGKEGRFTAAMRLFFAMPNFGVKPNTVTCGCLTDSLLKHGRTADTLKILRYMEENGIAPSEVMYTSLMSSAGSLAQQELNPNESLLQYKKETYAADNSREMTSTTFAPSCSAIEVYTLLMKSLTEDRVDSINPPSKSELGSSRGGETQDSKAHALMKVFLVFQEMKEAGAQADLACYNTLLRACARAGDVSRAQNVLKQMEEDALEPNDTSWRQLIRAAGNAKRHDIVLSTWKLAVRYSYDIKGRLGSSSSQIHSSYWVPTTDTFSSMISALLRSAAEPGLPPLKTQRLYQWIVEMYKRILSGNKDEQLGMHRVDKVKLFEDHRAMLLILEAIVSLDQLLTAVGVSDPSATNTEKSQLRHLAAHILELGAVRNVKQKQRLSRGAFRSLCVAQSWTQDVGATM
jgi:pentatricopeptide repeat protein